MSGADGDSDLEIINNKQEKDRKKSKKGKKHKTKDKQGKKVGKKSLFEYNGNDINNNNNNKRVRNIFNENENNLR